MNDQIMSYLILGFINENFKIGSVKTRLFFRLISDPK